MSDGSVLSGLRGPLLLAFALRAAIPALAAATGGRLVLPEDSVRYLALAHSLAWEGTFQGPSGSEIFRPPGYPLLLAAAERLGHPLAAAVLLQALCGTAVVAMAAWLARALAPAARLRVGWLAALATALDPTLVAWSGRIMAEPLLGLFVAATAVALVAWIRAPRPSLLLAAVACACGAAYTKPVAWLFPVLLVLVPCLRREDPWPRRLQRAGTMLVAAGLMLGPWHLRNGLATGYFGFSTQVDHVIGVGLPAAIRALRGEAAFTEERARIRSRFPDGPEAAAGQAERRAIGLATLRRSPLDAAVVQASGVARTLLLPGTLSWLDLFGLAREDLSATLANHGVGAALAAPGRGAAVLGMSAALGLASCSTLLAAAAGGWRLRRAIEARTLFLVIGYFVVAGGGPWGQARFRFPILPLMLALAAQAPLARQRPEHRLGEGAPEAA